MAVVAGRRSCRGGWKLDWDFTGDVLHLRPRDDLIWHPLSPDCVCGPASVPLTTVIGGEQVGTVIIHAALDGRDPNPGPG